MSQYIFTDERERPEGRYGFIEPPVNWSTVRNVRSVVHGGHEPSFFGEDNRSTGEHNGIFSFVSKYAISHPCTVLRRQCQVHHMAGSLHLTPLTFPPVVCNVIGNQGIQTLWKGAVGSGVLWALAATTEIIIGEFFGLPLTAVRHTQKKSFWRHLMLKASSYCVMTPFIVSSFIETVRSETGLSGDDFRIMDVITNGFYRLKSEFSMRDGSKRFSLFYLAFPTVLYHTSHYLIVYFMYEWIYKLAKRHVNKKPGLERTTFDQYFPDLFALMSSQVLADFICYPLETVLHRLYIQGTRTLIDNLDTGISAISITAKYSSLTDCVQRIVKQETPWALYAGAGALCLQYLLNFSFLRVVRTAFDYGMHILGENQGARTSNPSLVSPPSYHESVTHPSSQYFPSSVAPAGSTEYPSFGQTAASLGRHSPPERLRSFDTPFNPTIGYSFRSSMG
ncbi:unnamed protein product [Enterobius vermicularis]|uniref:Solute carrier family 25 member 46 n=1 Tax=Enterobius vermicularis TaxID=51028 RepID=A0A0N4VFX8_ENTVE|nr:unnamed protein product [Enterobius vermicularis]